MRLARYVGIALVAVTGCSKSQMPKGFERLRLGMPTADVVESLLNTREVAQQLYAYAYVSRPGAMSQKIEQPLTASKSDVLTSISKLQRLAGSDADVFLTARAVFDFRHADFDLDSGLRLTRASFTMLDNGEEFYEQLRAQAQARFGSPCKEYVNHPPNAPRACFLTLCKDGFEWQIEDRSEGFIGSTVLEVASSDASPECRKQVTQR